MYSYWQKDVFAEYDAVVVGAGITGLSAACRLLAAEPKHKVAVVERLPAPGGASIRNAGFACFGSLTELLAGRQTMNADDWQNLASERWQGIRALREQFSDEEIDFREEGGWELIFGANYHALNQLGVVNEALFPVFDQTVFTVRNDKIAAFGFPKDRVKSLVFNPLEGALHPGKLVRALWRKAAELGADVFFGYEAASFEEEENGWRLTCATPDVPDLRAPKVAFCGNAYDPFSRELLGAKPGRGQILLTRPLEGGVPFQGAFHFEEGYYYFRNLGDRVLFGGGRNLDLEAEETDVHEITDHIQNQLEQYLREIILPDRPFDIEARWAGVMAFSEDKTPVAREAKPGLFVAGGHSGMGVALGWPLAGRLVRLMTA